MPPGFVKRAHDERCWNACVAALLGRPYAISGRVAHGDKLGRNLGFPTANIPLRHPPALSGIFAVKVHGLGAAPRAGVASIGVRPTVKQDAKPLLDELQSRVAEELDYRLEAASQEAFAEAYEGDPDVYVPHIVAATDHVLVSEWMEAFDRRKK